MARQTLTTIDQVWHTTCRERFGVTPGNPCPCGCGAMHPENAAPIVAKEHRAMSHGALAPGAKCP